MKSRTFLPDETRPSRATGRGGGTCHRGCGRGGRAWAGGAEWVAAPAVVTSVTTSSRAVTDPALSGWTSVPGRTRRDEISRGFSVSRPTGPPADSIPSLRQHPAQDGLLLGGDGRTRNAPRAGARGRGPQSSGRGDGPFPGGLLRAQGWRLLKHPPNRASEYGTHSPFPVTIPSKC